MEVVTMVDVDQCADLNVALLLSVWVTSGAKGLATVTLVVDLAGVTTMVTTLTIPPSLFSRSS